MTGKGFPSPRTPTAGDARSLGTTLGLTVGAQLIVDPARAPDDDLLAVFSTRLRFWF